MQRFSDAVTAYRNAIRLEGSTAVRQVGLGEALTEAAGGLVSADAEAAFEAARRLEPTNARANFYSAIAMAQDGRKDEAKVAWQAMLSSLPADSPWRNAVTEALAEIDKERVAGTGQSGPTEQDVTAASSMSAEDRTAMIETMVAGLDDRLRENPKDAEGWMRLVRSYVVLGKAAQAKDALRRGMAAFGGDSEEAKKLVAFAASLGVPATE
jgi:cytochrome c-type biogenesis protein CcmH